MNRAHLLAPRGQSAIHKKLHEADAARTALRVWLETLVAPHEAEDESQEFAALHAAIPATRKV